MLKEASHSIGSLTIFSKQARYDYESWIQRKLNSDHPQMPGRARKLQVRLLPRSKRFSHSSLLKKWQISSCQFEKLCATNNPFYIGANSLFSAIDTSLLDRFNSRILSSRLNPISYITHLLQTKTINSFTNSSFASTAP